MNTITRNLLFLILLGSAVIFLPACGSKGSVKSQNPPETVLNPETTPVSSGSADIGMQGESVPVKTYVEKIHRSKGPKSTTITTTPVNAAGVTTPVATMPAQTPEMEIPITVKKSGGSHWFLWLLLVIVLAVIGWYFWSKKQEGNSPNQPKPPSGGLSPVSGYTAVKDRIEGEEDYKPSIWFKKLF